MGYEGSRRASNVGMPATWTVTTGAKQAWLCIPAAVLEHSGQRSLSIPGSEGMFLSWSALRLVESEGHDSFDRFL